MARFSCSYVTNITTFQEPRRKKDGMNLKSKNKQKNNMIDCNLSILIAVMYIYLTAIGLLHLLYKYLIYILINLLNIIHAVNAYPLYKASGPSLVIMAAAQLRTLLYWPGAEFIYLVLTTSTGEAITVVHNPAPKADTKWQGRLSVE